MIYIGEKRKRRGAGTGSTHGRMGRNSEDFLEESTKE